MQLISPKEEKYAVIGTHNSFFFHFYGIYVFKDMKQLDCSLNIYEMEFNIYTDTIICL